MRTKSPKTLPLLASFMLASLLATALSSAPKSYQASAQTLPSSIDVTNKTGQFLSSYYSGINGLKGSDLLEALNSKISGHREYSYDSDTDRYAYKIIDRNWDLSPLSPAQLASYSHASDNPYIRKFYADYNDSALTADRFQNEGAPRVSFDKEHIWAQSLGDFGRTGGAGSDFHSLIASDIRANQVLHKNYNFATPTSDVSSYDNDKGTFAGINGYIPQGSQKVMEPLDQYKGDIARAMFYMPARYFEYQDKLHPKLTLVNGSPTAVIASETQAGLAGDLETLLEWHELDPVDDYEIRRNNLIYNNYQLNRNPFIDYPQLAGIAYDANYSGSGAIISSSNACLIDVCSYYETSSAPLSSIAITHPATTTNYFIGETLLKQGLEITVYFEDATSKVIRNYDLSIAGQSDLVFSTSGTKTVTVAYTINSISKTTTFNVEVADLEDTALVVTAADLPFGKDFTSDMLDAEVIFTTPQGTFERTANTSNIEIVGLDQSKIGTQNIMANYGVLSGNLEIKVTNENSSYTKPIYMSDLIISEYVEGSSNNKVLEFYNGTGQTINLTGYSLKQFNGGESGSIFSFDFSSVTINHGNTYVIAHSSASLEIRNLANFTTSASFIGFNGNDAIGLYKNGELIDLFGIIGDSKNYAMDKTYVRKSNVLDPSDTWDTSEWNVLRVDTTSNLGSHTYINTEVILTAEEQALAYATYFRNITGPYCADPSTMLNIPWSTLSAEYDFMVGASKDVFVNSNDSIITDARKRYLLIIELYSVYANDDFVVDSSGSLLHTKKTVTITDNNDYLMFMLIAGLSLISISGYYFMKKNKHAL